MLISNTGNIEIDSFTVEIAGYQTKIECMPALRIGEKQYFDIDFSMPSDSKSIKIKVYISDEKDAILIMRTLELQVAYTDFKVAFNRQIVNGKQHFFIDIKNKTKISESGKLFVYVNDLCVNEIAIALSAEESENIDLILDDLQLNDFIYFVFIADNSEYDTSDNYHGYYSLQNEKTTSSMINLYATVLNNALGR